MKKVKTKKSTLKIETPKIEDLQNELVNVYKLANAWQKTAAKIGEDFLLLQKQLELAKFDSLRLDFISQNSRDGAIYPWTRTFTHIATKDGEELRDSIDSAKENEPPTQTLVV